MILKKLALASLIFGLPVPALAQIDAPVPAANYITFAGVDWAWASPCPPSGAGSDGTTCGNGSPLDLSYQSTLGWRLPTAAELAAGPSVTDFGTPGAFACASAWFSSYTHCDYSDAAGGAVFGAPGGNIWYAETWVVRGGAVPEPAAWGMLIGGIALVGAAIRRRSVKVAYAV